MSNNKPHLIFLCGTSSVGKTETVEKLAAGDYLPPFLPTPKGEITTVKMRTRQLRAKMGNPSWDTLMEDTWVADRHQKVIYLDFLATVKQTIAKAEPEQYFVFDRSPFDVGMYSLAYNLDSLNGRLMEHDHFRIQLKYMTRQANLYFILCNPSDSYKYVKIESRPPSIVRRKVALHFHRLWGFLDPNLFTPNVLSFSIRNPIGETFKSLPSRLIPTPEPIRVRNKSSAILLDDYNMILELAYKLGLNKNTLFPKVGSRTTKRNILPRKLIAYFLTVELGYQRSVVAEFIRKHRTTVMVHVAEVEAMRDDPSFDKQVTDLFNKFKIKG